MLRYSVKALNDTMEPEGLVPSMLVLGFIPYFPSGNKNDRDKEKRMGAIRSSRAEMEGKTSELRIKAVLKAKIPPSTKYELYPVHSVRVYREG